MQYRRECSAGVPAPRLTEKKAGGGTAFSCVQKPPRNRLTQSAKCGHFSHALHANYSPFDGRYRADGGPIHATCTPDCRPIRKAPAQPNATPPASTVHDLISSLRAFAGRAAPKERLVDSAGVPAPRLTAQST